MITVYALKWVPDFAKGLVRDLPVRWALEEAGLAYTSKLLTFEDKDTPQYRALQPFGQVPVFDDGSVRLFESGAIVLHIAEQAPPLMLDGVEGRARTRSWMFAALNTIDPLVRSFNLLKDSGDEAPKALEKVQNLLNQRLSQAASFLEGKDYLLGSFTAADLLLCAVLRPLRSTTLVSGDPVLGAYLKRCEARPAFQKALQAQLSDFLPEPPPGVKG